MTKRIRHEPPPRRERRVPTGPEDPGTAPDTQTAASGPDTVVAPSTSTDGSDIGDIVRQQAHVAPLSDPMPPRARVTPGRRPPLLDLEEIEELEQVEEASDVELSRAVAVGLLVGAAVGLVIDALLSELLFGG